MQNLNFTDTGPSRRLWEFCPWDEIGKTIRGVKFEDYFVNTPTLSTTAVTGLYACFADTGGAIVQDVGETLGGVKMTVDADDNQEVCIQTGGATGGMANFIDPATGSTPYSIWFEARLEVQDVVGNRFVGLMEPFTPAGDHITDAGALADKGLVGFASLEAAPTALSFTYKKNGQTVQVPIASVKTLAATTKVNVGFNYLYSNPVNRKVSVYVDNVLQSTGITKAQIEAATFADNVVMALTCAMKNVTDTMEQTLHWWRFAMVEN